jgi:hypothetical protein
MTKTKPGSPEREAEDIKMRAAQARAKAIRELPNPGPYGMFSSPDGGVGSYAGKVPREKPPTFQEVTRKLPEWFSEQLAEQTPETQKEWWGKLKFLTEYGVGDGEALELRWQKRKYEHDSLRKAPPYWNTPYSSEFRHEWDAEPDVRTKSPSQKVMLSRKRA